MNGVNMHPQQILAALAAGKEVGGINGSFFSQAIRQAFSQGAQALAVVSQMSSLMGATVGQASTAQAAPQVQRTARTAPPATARVASPSKPDRPESGPGSRWTAEEDERLKQAFQVRTPLSKIAETHQRSVMAVAMRLNKPHGLLSDEQLAHVRDELRKERLKQTPPPAATQAAPVQQAAMSDEPWEASDDAWMHMHDDEVPVLTDTFGEVAV